MKIKEGGGMDIQKERELFLAHMRGIGSAGFMFELDEDGNFDDMSMSYAWSAWQAAKAQAVPDLGELQERIAGHQYYHDEHGHMIVDMDDVVKEIGGFDSWKAQAVPEGFVLVPKEPTDEMLFAASGRDIVAEHYGGENIMWSELRETWKAMLEAAQEPAND